MGSKISVPLCKLYDPVIIERPAVILYLYRAKSTKQTVEDDSGEEIAVVKQCHCDDPSLSHNFLSRLLR